MGDHGGFPVHFECPELHPSHARTVERYFRTRRKSGGGDFEGPLGQDDQGVYCVWFKDQKDQREVLRRKNHVVKVGDASLTFDVRETSDKQGPPESARSKTDWATTTKTYTRASLPPSGERHELQVYSDVNLAVDVGEIAQVNARLDSLQENCNSKANRQLVLRLGEARLRLLWNRLEHSLERKFPKVKVSREEGGKLVLEGNAAEIHQVDEHIAGLDNQVKERTLSDFNPHVLTFLERAWVKPGIRDDFVGLGVEIELIETDLRLFSFSSASLDDVEQTLRTKFKIEEIPIANLSAVCSLRKKVKPTVRNINRDTCRVQVLASSDNIVYIVGHAKEVEELYEIVSQILVEDFEEESKAVELTGRSSSIDEHESRDRLLQDVPVEGDSPDIEGAASLEEQTRAAPKGTGEQTRAAPKGDTGGSVRVDFVEGTIETQQVDAVVSPMCGADPLSTRIGNCLYETVGPQLTNSYSKQDGGEMPGDTVLVEGLTGATFKAVLFVHLLKWDNDISGTAVQVMRLVVSEVLSSCEKRGFNSIAFPILGAGIVLDFPEDVVAQVLLEEIHSFDQRRTSTTPFRVSIVCPPSDPMLGKTFNSIQDSLERPVAKDSETKRIILLGKTGSGKSSLGNTILGEDLFTADDSPNSGTKMCQSQTKTINGRKVTVIDTPGLFDSERTEEELKPEILSCLAESSPGPHAFLIVLKVEKFTAQEQAVITEICNYFSAEALQYATVVFTHGNQLPPGTTIETFVKQSERLSELVRKCGNRCHVVDNTYWNDNPPDEYRNNQIQVEALLETIDQMVKGNNWGFYSNKVLEAMEKDIQNEMEVVNKESDKYMPPEELRNEAKKRVSNQWLISLVGVATGVVLGAFLGFELLFRLVMKQTVVQGAQKFASAVGFRATAGQMLPVAGAVVGVAGLGGGLYGGVIGGRAADGADSIEEAYERAKKAVMYARDNLKAVDDLK